MSGKEVLIIGGGPAGIELALQQATSGNKVYLVEEAPSLCGERALQDKAFNTDHLLVSAKLEEVKKNKDIQVITNAHLEQVQDKDGKFKVTIKRKASRVIEDKCDGCMACLKVCPVNLWDDDNQCLSFRNAIDFSCSETGVYNIIKEDMPPCQEICPVHLDIRGYIGLIADSRYDEALSLIRERLPFPGVCGRVCLAPCEGVCRQGKQGKAIAIRRLKRFVFENERIPYKEKPAAISTGKRIAIIGSGPTGLTAGYYLAKLGHRIVVYEFLPEPGGLMRAAIPESNLPRKILDQEIDNIRGVGVEIRMNTKVESLDSLFRQGYHVIFIATGALFAPLQRRSIIAYRSGFLATGACSGLMLGIEGEDDPQVIDGITCLNGVSEGRITELGEMVAVIGGGDIAIETAYTALKLGAKVTIFYRRTRQEMGASVDKVKEVIHEGAQMELPDTPLRIFRRDGKLTLESIRVNSEIQSASAHLSSKIVEGSKFQMEFDTVIIAIEPELPESFGLSLKHDGAFIVDSETLATSIPGVFAAGDAVTGPSSVIEAIAAGKKAAVCINKYLREG